MTDHPGTRDEMERLLIAACETEEAAIGKAFSETLLPSLPAGLKDLEAFRDLPAVDLGRMAYAFQDKSVMAAGVPGSYLAARGITPVHVAQASTAISHLASRVSGRAGEVSVAMRDGIVADLTRSELDLQVGLMTELPPTAAAALAEWILGASGHLANFIDRFSSRRDGERLVLAWTGRNIDFTSRWAATETASGIIEGGCPRNSPL